MMVSAIKEATVNSSLSADTLRKFEEQTNLHKELIDSIEDYFSDSKIWRGGMETRMTSLEKGIGDIYDLFDNLKFSGKVGLWLVSGIIGIVSVVGGLKAMLAWIGFQVTGITK